MVDSSRSGSSGGGERPQPAGHHHDARGGRALQQRQQGVRDPHRPERVGLEDRAHVVGGGVHRPTISPVMPALLTSTSSRPQRSSISFAAVATESSSVTSIATACTSPPSVPPRRAAVGVAAAHQHRPAQVGEPADRLAAQSLVGAGDQRVVVSSVMAPPCVDGRGPCQGPWYQAGTTAAGHAGHMDRTELGVACGCGGNGSPPPRSACPPGCAAAPPGCAVRRSRSWPGSRSTT